MFYIALWASKLYLFIKKCMGKGRSDRAGLLAARLYPNILTRIYKPKLVIMVSGTNGKSTISHLLYNILKLDNKKIGFNDWNANTRAGHIRCLIDSVNIFNKPNKDIAILECDELTSNETVPEIKPDYMIIINLCRDSIRRNAYPEFIFNRLKEATEKSTNTKLILNSDDPISSFLGSNNMKTFVSVEKQDNDVYENISPDFIVCPNCNTIVNYEYKIYRHMGKFKCPKCNLSSPEPDVFVKNIKDNSFDIGNETYKKLSNSLFNVYNEAMVIALLKNLGYNYDFINTALNKVNIPKSRENLEIVKGIKIYSQMAKGQNGSALSTVLENLSKLNNRKQILLLLDEDFGNVDAEETITWLYDSDFELLNNINLDKIIITGPRYLDYIARIKLAGVKQTKIESIEDYKEAYKLLDLSGKSDIYVLYDVDRRPMSVEVVCDIKNRIENEVNHENN